MFVTIYPFQWLWTVRSPDKFVCETQKQENLMRTTIVFEFDRALREQKPSKYNTTDTLFKIQSQNVYQYINRSFETATGLIRFNESTENNEYFLKNLVALAVSFSISTNIEAKRCTQNNIYKNWFFFLLLLSVSNSKSSTIIYIITAEKEK